jgi:hypothetical protein
VKKGGSIKLLREYFHQQCNIIGVDVDKGCPQFPNDAHIKVVLASSLDPTAMRRAFKVAFMVYHVHCVQYVRASVRFGAEIQYRPVVFLFAAAALSHYSRRGWRDKSTSL